MRGVFYDGDITGARRLDISRLAEPGIAIVVQLGPRRDDVTQVDIEMIQLANTIEFDARRNGQRQLAPTPGA